MSNFCRGIFLNRIDRIGRTDGIDGSLLSENPLSREKLIKKCNTSANLKYLFFN